MMLIMQIILALGVGAIIYAVFGVFTSGNAKPAAPKQKIQSTQLTKKCTIKRFLIFFLSSHPPFIPTLTAKPMGGSTFSTVPFKFFAQAIFTILQMVMRGNRTSADA